MRKGLTDAARAALLVGTAAIVAAAQTPLLKISAVSHSGNFQQVSISNVYTAPVTAYVFATTVAGARPGRNRVVKAVDSIPGDYGLRPALPPGGSGIIRMPDRGGAVTNVAVIYADGATAGDAVMIAHLLRVRTFYLRELPAVLTRLRAVRSNPAADRAQLLTAFQQQADAGRAALHDGVLGVSDRVADSVAATLQRFPNQNLQATAGALAKILFHWEQQLAASLPKLATSPETP